MERFEIARAAEVVGAAALAAALMMAALVYAARVVGPVQYGDIAAAMAVVYLVTLALGPLMPSIARVVARWATRDELGRVVALRRATQRIAYAAAVVVLAVAALLVGPAARWLRLQSWTTLAWATLTAVVYVLLSIDRAFLQGLFRFRTYNGNVVIEAIIRAALVFLLVRRLPAAPFILAAWAAGTLVAHLGALLSLDRAFPGAERPVADWSGVLQLLRPMIVLTLAQAVFQNTDLLIVKRFFSPADAGAYGAATVLTRTFGVLFVPLYVLAGPLMTEAHEKNRSVFALGASMAGAYAAIVATPLLVVAIWHRAVMPVVFGTTYAAGSAVLLPLAGITVLTYVGLMLAQALVTVGSRRYEAVYAACAVAQVLALLVVHADFKQVLSVLYVCQGAALLLVIIIFLNSQKMTRAGKSSSAA